MASEAQVKANRQNALKSTGPRTIEGKACASQNSAKHGLLSKDLLILDERLEELNSFRQGIYQNLCPQGAVEVLLVEKIINAAWRLRRVTKVEGEVIMQSNRFQEYDRGIHKAFRGCDGSCLQTLSRYEMTLERSFYKAIHELQRLQAMRVGVPVLAPVAIDFNV